jgi:hypothetical protein
MDFPPRFVEVPSSSQVPAEEIHGWVKTKGSQNREKAFSVLESLLMSHSETYAAGSAEPTLVDVYIALVSHYAPRPRSVIGFRI